MGELITKRQEEFLKLCCKGLRYQDIAKKMGKSVRTIDGYRDQLFKITRAKGRTGLIRYAVKNGIVDPKTW